MFDQTPIQDLTRAKKLSFFCSTGGLCGSAEDGANCAGGGAFSHESEGAKVQPHYHETVLREESVHFMTPRPELVLVDGTLGGGGHSELMLEQGHTVYGIDRDPEALAYAGERLARFGDRFQAVEGNFCDGLELMRERGVHSVDGFLADLGVSSRQFDSAARGFSFSKEGALDMRMGPACERTAADIVNTASEEEIATILWEYGEERASRKIARLICHDRETTPFTTTTQFASFIARVVPKGKSKIHPATRSFQALRIAVNDELGSLRKLLETSADLLKPGGRLCIISFHSLEDRMVKRFIRDASKKEVDKKEWPAPRPNRNYCYQILTKKPVTASKEEVERNSRSRSALLRVAERVSSPVE